MARMHPGGPLITGMLMAVFGALSAVAAPPEPSWSLPRTPAGDVVLRQYSARAAAPDAAARVLRVYVEDPSAPLAARAPIQGRYALRPDGLHFTPFFPFAAGRAYRAEARPAGAPAALVRFRVGAFPATSALPRVLDIAPSARALPANTLRFYITFASSMRDQFDRRAVHLTDDAGHGVAGAFMSFGEELWSADGCRLTLLLDPGRIKRGVTANQTEGPSLVPGRSYTLAVVLPASVRATTFRATAPLQTPLDQADWCLATPKAGTRAPLRLRFDRVMDPALLRDAVTVRAADGRRLAGVARDADGGREWRFIPDAPWGRAGCSVVFSDELEDICGNRIGEALDHEVGTTPARQDGGAMPFKPQ